MLPAGLTSFSSIAGKQATLEGPAVSTVKKAVKLYQVCPLAVVVGLDLKLHVQPVLMLTNHKTAMSQQHVV